MTAQAAGRIGDEHPRLIRIEAPAPADDLGVEFLGELPLDAAIRDHLEAPDAAGTAVFNRGSAALIASIDPDEVPYPEPAPPAAAPEPLQADVEPPALRVDPTFDPIIQRVAEEKGVDPRLVRAVIQVESGYQPRARSTKGAVGLMQLMPATARQYGVRNLYEPAANISAGVSHLKKLLDRFPLTLALAAYNAGEAAVERFAGIPPYPETLNYVSRIRALLDR